MTKSTAETPTVLVDMDGVLADFDKELLDRIAVRHPQIALLHQRNNFYVAEDYPEHFELVRAMSDEKGFFAALPVAEGAIHGWEQIVEHGYAPRICSAPITTNPHTKTEKLAWLEEHFVPVFGGKIIDQAIISTDKEEHDGIALIEDRPQVKNAELASWQHIVFDKSYNRHVVQPRLYGWNDANLLTLLKAAELRFAQK